MRPSARLTRLLWFGTAVLLASCGSPPGLDNPPGPTTPPPTTPTASPAPPASLPPGLPGATTSPGFGEAVAIDCAGRPGATELVGLLRTEGLLGPDADAQVVTGPLCAGTWQYAVVSVPDLDPLQVVTQGEAGALELVTAGTDVCSVEVRIEAPAGIRDAAACAA